MLFFGGGARTLSFWCIRRGVCKDRRWIRRDGEMDEIKKDTKKINKIFFKIKYIPFTQLGIL